ncbi:hypothetical protein SmJEL517_g05117 [Synchytrium microbalum]|uniref:Uncharacterized protein n=1 Tax=Synchytrium microbalum TaxID=1806994 RepID=A0A507BQX3_9FUNG|nr:uncharacterized protein SmJEL517_g05117 [Synchytrium microbalum]TPX31577.1 hypothetical protein SmJEL517_g05117 [Synchytrium microbalum]
MASASVPETGQLEDFLRSSTNNAVKSYIVALQTQHRKIESERIQLIKDRQQEAFNHAETRAQLLQSRQELLAANESLEKIRHTPFTASNLNALTQKRQLQEATSEIEAGNAAVIALKTEIDLCHRTIATIESESQTRQSRISELERERTFLAEQVMNSQSEVSKLTQELAKVQPGVSPGESIADARAICPNCGHRNPDSEKVFGQLVEMKGELVRLNHSAQFYKATHLNTVKQLNEERVESRNVLEKVAQLTSELRLAKEEERISQEQVKSYMASAETSQKQILNEAEQFNRQVSADVAQTEAIKATLRASAFEQYNVTRAALDMVLILSSSLAYCQEELTIARVRVSESIKQSEEYSSSLAGRVDNLSGVLMDVSKKLTVIRRTLAADRTSTSSQRLAEDLAGIITLVNAKKDDGAALAVSTRADLTLVRKARLITAENLVSSILEESERDRTQMESAMSALQDRVIKLEDQLLKIISNSNNNRKMSIVEAGSQQSLNRPSGSPRKLSLDTNRRSFINSLSNLDVSGASATLDRPASTHGTFEKALKASILEPISEDAVATSSVPITSEDATLVSMRSAHLVRMIREKDAEMKRLKEEKGARVSTPVGNKPSRSRSISTESQRGRKEVRPKSPTRKPSSDTSSSPIRIVARNRILEERVKVLEEQVSSPTSPTSPSQRDSIFATTTMIEDQVRALSEENAALRAHAQLRADNEEFMRDLQTQNHELMEAKSQLAASLDAQIARNKDLEGSVSENKSVVPSSPVGHRGSIASERSIAISTVAPPSPTRRWWGLSGTANRSSEDSKKSDLGEVPHSPTDDPKMAAIIQDKDQEIAKLRNHLASTATQYSSKMEALSEERDSLRESVSELMTQVQTYQSRLAGLQLDSAVVSRTSIDHSDLQRSLSGKHEQLSEALETTESLKGEVKSLQDEIHILRDQLEQKHQELSQLADQSSSSLGRVKNLDPLKRSDAASRDIGGQEGRAVGSRVSQQSIVKSQLGDEPVQEVAAKALLQARDSIVILRDNVEQYGELVQRLDKKVYNLRSENASLRAIIAKGGSDSPLPRSSAEDDEDDPDADRVRDQLLSDYSHVQLKNDFKTRIAELESQHDDELNQIQQVHKLSMRDTDQRIQALEEEKAKTRSELSNSLQLVNSLHSRVDELQKIARQKDVHSKENDNLIAEMQAELTELRAKNAAFQDRAPVAFVDVNASDASLDSPVKSTDKEISPWSNDDQSRIEALAALCQRLEDSINSMQSNSSIKSSARGVDIALVPASPRLVVTQVLLPPSPETVATAGDRTSISSATPSIVRMLAPDGVHRLSVDDPSRSESILISRERNDLKAQVSQLQQWITNKDSELNTIKANLDASKESLEAKEKELHAAVAERELAYMQLTRSSQAVSSRASSEYGTPHRPNTTSHTVDMENIVKGLEEDRRKLHDALIEVMSERDRARSELALGEAELAEARNTLEAANTLWEQSEMDKMNLEAQVRALVKERQRGSGDGSMPLPLPVPAVVPGFGRDMVTMKMEMTKLEIRLRDLELSSRATEEHLVDREQEHETYMAEAEASIKKLRTELDTAVGDLEFAQHELKRTLEDKEIALAASTPDDFAAIERRLTQELVDTRALLDATRREIESSRAEKAEAITELASENEIQFEQVQRLSAEVKRLEALGGMASVTPDVSMPVPQSDSKKLELRNMKQEADGRHAELTAKAAFLQSQLDLVSLHNENVLREYEGLKASRDEADNNSKMVSQELAEARSAIANYEKRLATVSAELDKHKLQVANLQTVKAEAESLRSIKSETDAASAKELATATQELANAKSVIAMHQNRLQETIQERDAYVMRHEVMDRELSALRDELEAAAVSTRDLNSKVNEHVVLIETLKAAVAEKNARIQQISSEHQVKLADANRELELVKNNHAELVATHESKLADTSAMLTSRGAELEQLKAAREADIAQAKSSHERHLSGLNTEKLALVARIQELEADLALQKQESSAAIALVSSRLEDLKASSLETKSPKQHDTVMEMLVQQDQELSQTVAQLESQIDDLKAGIAEKDQQIEQLSAKINTLSESHAKEISERDSHLETLKSRQTELAQAQLASSAEAEAAHKSNLEMSLKFVRDEHAPQILALVAERDRLQSELSSPSVNVRDSSTLNVHILQKQYKQLQDDHDNIRKDYAKLRLKLGDTEAQLQKGQDEKIRKQAASPVLGDSDEIVDLLARIGKLEQALEVTAAECERLTAENKSLRNGVPNDAELKRSEEKWTVEIDGLRNEIEAKAIALENVQGQLESLQQKLSEDSSFNSIVSESKGKPGGLIKGGGAAKSPSMTSMNVNLHALHKAAESEIFRLRQHTVDLGRLKQEEISSLQKEWDNQKRDYLATLSTLLDDLQEAANASDIMKAQYEHTIAELRNKSEENRRLSKSIVPPPVDENEGAKLKDGLLNLKSRISVDRNSLNSLLGQLSSYAEVDGDIFIRIAEYLSEYFSLFGEIMDVIRPEALKPEFTPLAYRILSDNPLFNGTMTGWTDDASPLIQPDVILDGTLGNLMYQFIEQRKEFSTSMTQIRSLRSQALNQPLAKLESSWNSVVEQRAYLTKLVQHLMRTVVKLRANQKSKNAAIRLLRSKPSSGTSASPSNDTVPKALYDSIVSELAVVEVAKNKLKSELSQARSVNVTDMTLFSEKDALSEEVQELQAAQERATERIEALSAEVKVLHETKTKTETEFAAYRRIKESKGSDNSEEFHDAVAKLEAVRGELSRLQQTSEQDKERFDKEKERQEMTVNALLDERETAFKRMNFAFEQMKSMETELAQLKYNVTLPPVNANEVGTEAIDKLLDPPTGDSVNTETVQPSHSPAEIQALENQLIDTKSRLAHLQQDYDDLTVEMDRVISSHRADASRLQYDVAVLQGSTVPKSAHDALTEEADSLRANVASHQELVAALQNQVRDLEMGAAGVEAERDNAQGLVVSLRARLDEALKGGVRDLGDEGRGDNDIASLNARIRNLDGELARLTVDNESLMTALRSRDMMLVELREKAKQSPAPTRAPLMASIAVQVNEKRPKKAVMIHAATMTSIKTFDQYVLTEPLPQTTISIQTDPMMNDHYLETVEEEHTIERVYAESAEYAPVETHLYSKPVYQIETYQLPSLNVNGISTNSYTHQIPDDYPIPASSYPAYNSDGSNFDTLRFSKESFGYLGDFYAGEGNFYSGEEFKIEQEISQIRKKSLESLRNTATTLKDFYNTGNTTSSASNATNNTHVNPHNVNNNQSTLTLIDEEEPSLELQNMTPSSADADARAEEAKILAHHSAVEEELKMMKAKTRESIEKTAQTLANAVSRAT